MVINKEKTIKNKKVNSNDLIIFFKYFMRPSFSKEYAKIYNFMICMLLNKKNYYGILTLDKQ